MQLTTSWSPSASEGRPSVASSVSMLLTSSPASGLRPAATLVADRTTSRGWLRTSVASATGCSARTSTWPAWIQGRRSRSTGYRTHRATASFKSTAPRWLGVSHSLLEMRLVEGQHHVMTSNRHVLMLRLEELTRIERFAQLGRVSADIDADQLHHLSLDCWHLSELFVAAKMPLCAEICATAYDELYGHFEISAGTRLTAHGPQFAKALKKVRELLNSGSIDPPTV